MQGGLIKLLRAGCLSFALLSAAAQSPSMPKDAHPSFEVATIRPTNPDDRNQGFHTQGRRVFIENESVTSMLMLAYGLHDKQIVDGPPWISDRFDVVGVSDVDGEPNLAQLQEMVQKLLVSRFGLKFHHDKRLLSVYTITIAKGGPKLTPSKSDPNAQPDQSGNGTGKGQMMRFTNNSMSDFALSMQYFLDRPAVDRTGLTGRYDFTLEWKPGLSPAEDSDEPGLFTAIQEQLGLKLTATKDIADVLIVDHLEHPSEN